MGPPESRTSVTDRKLLGAGSPSSLRNSLQHLYSLKPTREGFAEEAVKLIARSARAKAVALLLHEARKDTVKLAATDGLESDAIQVLRGDSGRTGWDIPLRAVRSHRINVIEAAQANPFVPKALVAINPRQLTIAVIPFYQGNAPVGVAVLFAPTQKGFPDAMLQMVSQALRICALALSELPPAEPETARAAAETRQPTLLRGVATLKAELTRLGKALEEAERQRASEVAERVTAESFLKAQRERVATLEEEIATLRSEQERYVTLEADLEALKTDLAESRATGEAGRSEIARLQTSLAETQEALKIETSSTRTLESQVEELQTELAESRAAVETGRNTILRLQASLGETQEALKSETGSSQTLTSELEGLKAEFAEARATVEAERKEISRLQTSLAETQAALETEEGSTKTLESELEGLKTELAESRATVEAGHNEIARLQTSLAELQESLRKESESAKALTASREELQENLDEAVALSLERDAAVGKLEERVEELTLELERASRLESDLAEQKGGRSQLETELSQVREELRQSRVEATHAKGEVEALRAQAERSETALASSKAQLASTEERVAVLTAELEEAGAKLKELDVARESLAGVQEDLRVLEAERKSLREEIGTVRSSSEAGAKELEETVKEQRTRLSELETERGRLSEALDQARNEAEQTLARLREFTEASDRDRAQMSARIEELSRTEAERARVQAQVEDLTNELSKARNEVESLDGRINQISDVNSRLIAERRELHARIESLTKGGETLEQAKQAAINAAQQRVTELESALGRMAKTVNSARANAAEELSQVRAELASAAEEEQQLKAQLTRVREELEGRERELADTAAERDRLLGEAAAFKKERTALTARLETGTTEAEKLAQAYAEGNRRVDALQAELKGVIETRDTLTRELEETRERLTREAEEKLAAAEAARKELEGALEAERKARGTEVASLHDQLGEVRRELDNQLAEMVERHQAAEDASKEECDRLSQALAEKEQLLHSIEEGLATGELAEVEEEEVAVEADAELDLDSLLVIDRSVGDEELTVEREEGSGEGDGVVSAPEQVLILDAPETGATTAHQLAEFGYKTTSISPNGELAVHLAQNPVACAAVNLGEPEGWGAIRALRTGEQQMTTALVAYALAPGSTTGFWFGPVDFALLPVTESVTELLQRMIPNVRRAIAMSADLDVMSDVREELNKGRISTAVVLDGRQALDLVPTVRPDAAVLHLSPSSTDVFRAIAGLRNSEFGRDIPILFLLDAEPQEREGAFINAGVRMLSGRGNLKATELVAALVDILEPYRGG